MTDSPPSYAVLAEGLLNLHDAKTAVSLIRYQPEQVAVVIDSTNSGRTVDAVLGLGQEIPIVATLEEALRVGPNRLLVGIVPADGALPDAWRKLMLTALDSGLDLYSGMHTLLADDSEFAERAHRRGRRIVDLRAVPAQFFGTLGARDQVTAPVVLTVGSDCNIGKMTASLEVIAQADRVGRVFGFVATGQTGILLTGSGMAVDRVISDFVSRATEELVVEGWKASPELLLVEGQGSLLHPLYSGVTLGLLHGCRPDAMILCHKASRKELRHCPGRKIPRLSRLIEIHEEAAGWLEQAPVIGIALATVGLDDGEATRALEAAGRETGLPVEDVVRFPNGALLAACVGLIDGARSGGGEVGAACGSELEAG